MSDAAAWRNLRLDRLLGGTTPDTFRREYQDRMHLVVREAVQPALRSRILSIDRFDELVTAANLGPPYLDVIREGRTANPPARHAGRTDVAGVVRGVAGGASIRVRAVDRHVPGVAAACAVLADELGEDVVANAYMTPQGAQAFDPHYDDHDVWVIQCWGEKTWRIYESYSGKLELPLEGMAFVPGEHLPEGGIEEFTLRPGDLLYVPRGLMHAAHCAAGASLHLTFSTSVLTIGAAAAHYLDALHRRDAGLRGKVWLDDLADPEGRRRLAAGIGRLTGMEVDPELLADVVEDMVGRTMDRTTPVLTGSLAAAMEGDARKRQVDPALPMKEIRRDGVVRMYTPLGLVEAGEDEAGVVRDVRRTGVADPDAIQARHPDMDVEEVFEGLEELGLLRPAGRDGPER